ncbi:hypothetical protein D5F52_26680 (plasmid) [Brevibacillus laterosporus]|uniref:Flp pilus assembly protein CpaB n=1 Tax=Brevibacillus laterosporus TaxID=1465 RepID=UPI000E6CC0D6|nr:RcpC/CpaB family pilus assembly protein [Brevibacillus laterosporus]AYB41742.1 hypothetical protein D5F52_26680 [Brevibacillus laterosporus]
MRLFFMRKRGQFLIGLLFTGVLAVGAYITYDLYQKERSQVIEVLTATQEIPPRTMITKQMFDDGIIKSKELPIKSVPPTAISDMNDVLNKFTSTNYTVPQHSFLFKGKILTAEEMKDGAAMLLRENEKMVAIDTNLRSSLAAQITEGSYIDLWLSTESKEDRKPVIGPFLEKVRVIGTYATGSQKSRPTSDTPMKTSDDQPVTTIGSNIVPQTILLAVENDQVALIQLAQKLGKIEVAGVAYKDYEKPNIETTNNGQWSVSRMQSWMTGTLSNTFQIKEGELK